MDLEKYFSFFKEGIVGNQAAFISPYGPKQIVYLDWTASGRLYLPIEEMVLKQFGPYIANTHTESNITGGTITAFYHGALNIIKQHVNAKDIDVIIAEGSGMTGVINKLQRILGLKIHEKYQSRITLSDTEKPVVFLTEMEHHSNHTSWLETICDVEIIPNHEQTVVDLDFLKQRLAYYQSKNRPLIGAFTACSNVTGLITPYHQLAKLMHAYNGICIVDFAASAPYVEINMHPEDEREKLDAILFSPHKFLGGPGSSGVLIFDSALYHNQIPDHPGGGTVEWTNPWGGKQYMHSIERREEGGTPGILQAIRAALAINLKNKMGIDNMLAREKELTQFTLAELKKIPNVVLLDQSTQPRIGIISFYLKDIHHFLAVRLLNDRYGIQIRGGCFCAGTYGHKLLDISPVASKQITDQIDHGNLAVKPGWLRLSLHPTTTYEEVLLFTRALREITQNISEWCKDYVYINHEFHHVKGIRGGVESYFRI